MVDVARCLQWVVLSPLVAYRGQHHGQDSVDVCGATCSANETQEDYYLVPQADAVLAGEATMALDSRSCPPVRTRWTDQHFVMTKYSMVLFSAKG
jgi:hypothetical protein